MLSPLNQDWLDEVAQRRLTADEAARWRHQLSERPSEARRLEEELALNHLWIPSPGREFLATLLLESFPAFRNLLNKSRGFPDRGFPDGLLRAWSEFRKGLVFFQG